MSVAESGELSKDSPDDTDIVSLEFFAQSPQPPKRIHRGSERLGLGVVSYSRRVRKAPPR